MGNSSIAADSMWKKTAVDTGLNNDIITKILQGDWQNFMSVTPGMVQGQQIKGVQNINPQQVGVQKDALQQRAQAMVPEIESGYRSLMKPEQNTYYQRYVKEMNQQAPMAAQEAAAQAGGFSAPGMGSAMDMARSRAASQNSLDTSRALADVGMNAAQYETARKNAGLSGLQSLFGTQAGLGAQNSQLATQVAMQNAANALTAGQQNASNQLSTQQFNAESLMKALLANQNAGLQAGMANQTAQQNAMRNYLSALLGAGETRQNQSYLENSDAANWLNFGMNGLGSLLKAILPW